jgi:hypothetical protein
VRPALRVRAAFSDRYQQKCFAEEIQCDGARLGVPAGFRRLTTPFSSGISHAHAGLEKTAPAASFHSFILDSNVARR